MPELTWGYEYVDPNASTTPAVQRSGTLVTGCGARFAPAMRGRSRACTQTERMQPRPRTMAHPPAHDANMHNT